MQVLVQPTLKTSAFKLKILAIIHAVMQFDCVCNELAINVTSYIAKDTQLI